MQLATGTKRKVTSFVQECEISMNNFRTQVDLNILPLGSYDLLIGMDWLEKHRVILDCFDKTFSCLVLVVEPDYLPDSEIFVSAMTYTPGGLHTHEDCTPFYDGGVRGPAPPMGVRGQRPQSQKMGCFGQWFWTIVLVHGFVGPCFSADGFGHCNNLYILYYGLECIVS